MTLVDDLNQTLERRTGKQEERHEKLREWASIIEERIRKLEGEDEHSDS